MCRPAATKLVQRDAMRCDAMRCDAIPLLGMAYPGAVLWLHIKILQEETFSFPGAVCVVTQSECNRRRHARFLRNPCLKFNSINKRKSDGICEARRRGEAELARRVGSGRVARRSGVTKNSGLLPKPSSSIVSRLSTTYHRIRISIRIRIASINRDRSPRLHCTALHCRFSSVQFGHLARCFFKHCEFFHQAKNALHVATTTEESERKNGFGPSVLCPLSDWSCVMCQTSTSFASAGRMLKDADLTK
jgi:hypothetical protein